MGEVVEVVMDASMGEVVEVVMDASMGEVAEVVMDASMGEVVAVVDHCFIGVINMDIIEIPTCCHESWALLTEYMKSHEINNLYSIFNTIPNLIQTNVLYTLLHAHNIYKILVVDHDIGYITDMFLHNKPDAMVLAYSEEPVPYRNIVADYLKNRYENRYYHINSVNNGHVNISSEDGYSPLFDQVDLIFISGENNSPSYNKHIIQSCRSLAHANTILAFTYSLPHQMPSLDASMMVVESTEVPIESSIWHDVVHESIISPMGQTKLDTTNCMAWGKYNFAEKPEEPTTFTLDDSTTFQASSNDLVSELPSITTSITEEVV